MFPHSAGRRAHTFYLSATLQKTMTAVKKLACNQPKVKALIMQNEPFQTY